MCCVLEQRIIFEQNEKKVKCGLLIYAFFKSKARPLVKIFFLNGFYDSRIEAHLNESTQPKEAELKELEVLPKRGRFAKAIPWILPVLVMGMVAYFASQGEAEDLLTLFTVWTAANAVFAALGCILARGHPLAILTAALASPITSLNPTLAAGWFAGYVQLKLREPTAEDLQNFLKMDDLGAFWSNRAGRVLLVTALTNLGSMAGAWVAAAGYLGGLGS